MALRSGTYGRTGEARLRARLALVLSTVVGLLGAPVAAAAVESPRRDIPDLALVVTAAGETSAVRSGEPYFARLWMLLQPTYTGTARVPEAWVKGKHPPVRITVVWGLTGVGGWPQTNRPPGRDVALRREDQLFLAEDGTPWVRSDPLPEVEDDDIRWHQAPRSVFEQLDRAGRLGEAVELSADAGGRTADASDTKQPDQMRYGAWCAAAGLAAGVGGTLLIRRAAARREAGPPREEPRQELIEL